MSAASVYSSEELLAIYELGRMYYEMGFFVPAERIFGGLITVDNNSTPARVGLGLLKVERGLYQDSTVHFRASIQAGAFVMQAKLGLVAAFLGLQEIPRARSLLAEIGKEMSQTPNVDQNLKTLAEAYAERCAA